MSHHGQMVTRLMSVTGENLTFCHDMPMRHNTITVCSVPYVMYALHHFIGLHVIYHDQMMI